MFSRQSSASYQTILDRVDRNGDHYFTRNSLSSTFKICFLDFFLIWLAVSLWPPSAISRQKSILSWSINKEQLRWRSRERDSELIKYIFNNMLFVKSTTLSRHCKIYLYMLVYLYNLHIILSVADSNIRYRKLLLSFRCVFLSLFLTTLRLPVKTRNSTVWNQNKFFLFFSRFVSVISSLFFSVETCAVIIIARLYWPNFLAVDRVCCFCLRCSTQCLYNRLCPSPSLHLVSHSLSHSFFQFFLSFVGSSQAFFCFSLLSLVRPLTIVHIMSSIRRPERINPRYCSCVCACAHSKFWLGQPQCQTIFTL